MEEIVNRVANSPLVTLDLEGYYHPGERVLFDIKDQLFQGMVLKEKDFRYFVKAHDWESYNDKNVAIYCSAEAIVPTWAYMLLTLNLAPYANKIVFGDLRDLETSLYNDALSKINPNDYRDKKVVIKGCSKFDVPVSAYVEIARILQPVVNSLMYGEPCSTVPLYKKPKNI